MIDYLANNFGEAAAIFDVCLALSMIAFAVIKL